jgi:peptidoglycan hydrolase-like protein with peptidoglycan-binding domain
VRGLAQKKKVETEGEVNEDVAKELGETSTAHLAPRWFREEQELGSEGPDVQRARDLLGLTSARGVRNENRYDPDMEKAVRRFQSDRGIKPTGRLDAETARALGGD